MTNGDQNGGPHQSLTLDVRAVFRRESTVDDLVEGEVLFKLLSNVHGLFELIVILMDSVVRSMIITFPTNHCLLAVIENKVAGYSRRSVEFHFVKRHSSVSLIRRVIVRWNLRRPMASPDSSVASQRISYTDQMLSGSSTGYRSSIGSGNTGGSN